MGGFIQGPFLRPNKVGVQPYSRTEQAYSWKAAEGISERLGRLYDRIAVRERSRMQPYGREG